MIDVKNIWDKIKKCLIKYYVAKDNKRIIGSKRIMEKTLLLWQ
jgi:hypothetical protein